MLNALCADLMCVCVACNKFNANMGRVKVRFYVAAPIAPAQWDGRQSLMKLHVNVNGNQNQQQVK